MTGKNRIMKTARGQPFPLAHRCASSQCIWG